jgi:hypothetical protein
MLPGQTYEYRVRVVMMNPNHKQPQLVSRPEDALMEELFGLWSEPSGRVTFTDEALVYADEPQKRDTRDRSYRPVTKDMVPVQIHKWIGNIPGVGTVGNWWVDRTQAVKGEFIGQKKEVPNLVVWVATAFDQMTQQMGMEVLQKREVPAFITGKLLVDFEGGNEKVSHKAFNKSVPEDVPAEIMVVEPNGRMIVKKLVQDKNDQERQDRYDNWKKWVESVQNRRGQGTNTGQPPGGGVFDR